MTELVATSGTRSSTLVRFRDFAALGKPRLSLLVIFTTAMGFWLAPAPPGSSTILVFLLATSALVAAANTLNCWIEKDTDGLMMRTCDRPLPAGRMEPRTALAFGIVLALGSLATIAATSNALTTLLGALALSIYAAVYTPLKRVTPWAVAVGAIPGAMPPLMGWTAATGHLAPAGLFLFGILFFWQLPHFIAISLYLEPDFRRAGIRALPIALGRRPASAWLLATVAALLAFSLLALPLGVAGRWYAGVAGCLGAAWTVLAALALRGPSSDLWARRLFGASLIYLPLVVTALVLDAV